VDELALALHRVDLDPGALTAAGVSPGSVADVVGNARAYLIEYEGQLAQADQSFADAKAQCASLRKLIRSGQGTQDDLTAYTAAQAALASARSQRDGLLDDLFDDATANLTGDHRTTLTQIRGNSPWKLPLEFLVVERSESDWVTLRDALANERIAQKLDVDPDPDAQGLLTQLRAVTAVSTAKANLDANLATVTSAWDQAVGY